MCRDAQEKGVREMRKAPTCPKQLARMCACICPRMSTCMCDLAAGLPEDRNPARFVHGHHEGAVPRVCSSTEDCATVGMSRRGNSADSVQRCDQMCVSAKIRIPANADVLKGAGIQAPCFTCPRNVGLASSRCEVEDINDLWQAAQQARRRLLAVGVRAPAGRMGGALA